MSNSTSRQQTNNLSHSFRCVPLRGCVCFHFPSSTAAGSARAVTAGFTRRINTATERAAKQTVSPVVCALRGCVCFHIPSSPQHGQCARRWADLSTRPPFARAGRCQSVLFRSGWPDRFRRAPGLANNGREHTQLQQWHTGGLARAQLRAVALGRGLAHGDRF
jgi:hypothetical protein